MANDDIIAAIMEDQAARSTIGTPPRKAVGDDELIAIHAHEVAMLRLQLDGALAEAQELRSAIQGALREMDRACEGTAEHILVEALGDDWERK